jgi:hypothetical protein
LSVYIILGNGRPDPVIALVIAVCPNVYSLGLKALAVFKIVIATPMQNTKQTLCLNLEAMK